MGKQDKLLYRILTDRHNNGYNFDEMCSLLKSLGFSVIVRGSHHKFTHPHLKGILNLQPKKHEVKPYQVRQIRGALAALEATKETRK
jgi:predicted RNA binding protein YcfA (HicA-like mRNA interferase family)